jgi:threonine dehydrogenase-like Zn-dependent dehydrogenase
MPKGWGLAIGVAAVMLAPAAGAAAQPIQPGNAQQTIDQLEDEGYDVVIDRVGSAPINQCLVTSVRNPQEVTQTFVVGKGKDREVITVVVSRSITISLNCSR